MKPFIMNKLIVFFVFMTSCSGMKNTQANIQELTHKIQNRDYTVLVNYANPMRGKQIYLTSQYDLRIKKDSAFSYLPFFGIAYSAPYGGGEGGIKFSEPMINYSIKSNKKSTGWDIHFKVKAKEDEYEIFLNISNNGSATFSVNSINKQVISFDGEVKK